MKTKVVFYNLYCLDENMNRIPLRSWIASEDDVKRSYNILRNEYNCTIFVDRIERIDTKGW